MGCGDFVLCFYNTELFEAYRAKQGDKIKEVYLYFIYLKIAVIKSI
jgi:hypothetical protein